MNLVGFFSHENSAEINPASSSIV